MTPTLRTSTSLILIAALLLIGCGAGTTSPLIAALEAISIAADVNLTATEIGYFAVGYDASTFTSLWALGWQ